jgi:hypothetical protein
MSYFLIYRQDNNLRVLQFNEKSELEFYINNIRSEHFVFLQNLHEDYDEDGIYENNVLIIKGNTIVPEIVKSFEIN